MHYVFSDWIFLEWKIDKYIAQLGVCLALKKFQRLSDQALLQLQQIYGSLTSISLWRLSLLVLKRIIGIIKAGLKYFLIELPVPVLEFLYVLHFFRAFLTLIDFLKDKDNKNLVEITKFLYACFKVFISLLMLSFLIALLMQGMAPLGLLAYGHIKILFRIYTFSKFGISLLTLGLSYYKIKSCPNDAEHAWQIAQYQANFQKHTHILVLGTLITMLLTLVSVFGFGLGPIGLAVVIVLAGLLLVVDIAKAIYFYKNSCSIPEPCIGSLSQQNSLIDFSVKDYYYRKWRTARLKQDDPEANRIYLLKEIVVKIIQLETQLKNSHAKFSFFRTCFYEKQKIQKKLADLMEAVQELLKDKQAKVETAIALLIALQIDIQEVKDSGSKPIVSMTILQEYLQGLKDQLQLMNSGDTGSDKLALNHKNNKLWKVMFTEGMDKKSISISQSTRQSFFRKKSDCEDISDACQQLKGWGQRSLALGCRPVYS